MYATRNIGIRTICAELSNKGYKNTNGNDFSFSTIKNILINPKYKGYYCGNKTHKYDYRSSDRKYFDKEEWKMYKDEENVPPIVSEELWDKANRILTNRSERLKNENISYSNKYSYSGKIICSEHKCSYQRSMYRYPSGNKEIWQCRKYYEKGKAGCTMPILYTTELNQVMKECYDEIVTNKADIIHDLVKVYSSISQKSNIKEDIAKYRVEINDVIKRKDKLLDLSIAGKLSDEEFENRNNSFNKEIDTLKVKITDLEEEERKNADIEESVEKLRKVIAKELNFENGFDNAIIDSLLDKIEVYKTDEKNVIDIKVYIKVIDETLEYRINRGRKSTSVCTVQYI
ncbi:MAG: recombinase family protein [Oscillospiraceae bacterium]|nr:recombinase family protein [Oscillospiraceae bacterium]